MTGTWIARAVGGALLLLVLLVPARLSGQCNPAPPVTGNLRAGESIGIVAGPNLAPSVVEEAVALWRECSDYGHGFPSFVSGKGQTRTITVEYHPQSASAACGLFLGSRIDLFAFARDAGGRHLSCGPAALLLAHELGHVLGLAHVRNDGRCKRHIMTEIHRHNRHHREVQDVECQAADRLWLTRSEMQVADDGTSRTSPAVF